MRYWIQIILSLLLGGGIYLIYRSEDLLMFSWAERSGLGGVISFLRSLAIADVELADWVLYSLPDALWLFAFCLFFIWVWQGQQGKLASAWRLFPAVVALVWECGQLTPFVSGTFDPIDLFFYLLAAVLAYGQR